jgi:hypothetical protein
VVPIKSLLCVKRYLCAERHWARRISVVPAPRVRAKGPFSDYSRLRNAVSGGLYDFQCASNSSVGYGRAP